MKNKCPLIPASIGNITEVITEAKENCLWLNHETGSQNSVSFPSYHQMHYSSPYPNKSAYSVFQKDNWDFCMYAHTHLHTSTHPCASNSTVWKHLLALYIAALVPSEPLLLELFPRLVQHCHPHH